MSVKRKGEDQESSKSVERLRYTCTVKCAVQ
jgi:hypothetical protein